MALILDLRHYETVVSIVELGTMTAAAKQLSTTQSALSHRLAEAERRLGVRLFDRGPGRKLKPTRAGLVVHQTASRALADLERSEALLLAEDHRVIAIVRIGVGSYDCFHWYPGFLATARSAHPDIDVELVIAGDSPGSALAEGAADLVIAPGEPEGNVMSRHLFDDELVALVHPEHRLCGKPWLTPRHLANEFYLTYNSSPVPGFEYDRFIRPGETYPRIVTVVPQTSAITEMVAAGAGVSILSRWALTPAIENRRVVPIRCGPDGLSLPWVAVLRADEPEGSPATRIAELLATTLAPQLAHGSLPNVDPSPKSATDQPDETVAGC